MAKDQSVCSIEVDLSVSTLDLSSLRVMVDIVGVQEVEKQTAKSRSFVDPCACSNVPLLILAPNVRQI